MNTCVVLNNENFTPDDAWRFDRDGQDPIADRYNRWRKPRVPSDWEKEWTGPFIKKPPKVTPRDTIICPHCGKDTGIGRVLLMVIYPPGLRCPQCGKIAVSSGPTVTL